MFPLITIITITAIKDLYEDWKRHKSDNEENAKNVLTGNYTTFNFEQWKNLKVGQIVKINENEFFPADLLILRSSDSKGFYYKFNIIKLFIKEYAILKQRI